MIRVKKRNGQAEVYNGSKIIRAIERAMAEGSGVDSEISTDVESKIKERLIQNPEVTFSVDDINDMCEEYLMASGKYNTAKRFILYRNERSKERGVINWKRGTYKYLKDEFLEKYMQNPDPFPNELSKFTFYRTYSRPVPEYQRRETWAEVCARVVDFNLSLRPDTIKEGEAETMYDMMYNLKLFPSGRTLFVGGTQSSRLYALSNFNCSHLSIDKFSKFGEMLYVLMLGVGVGVNLRKQFVDKLPKINTHIELVHQPYKPANKADRVQITEIKYLNKFSIELIVGDDKYAWKKALDYYFEILTSQNYRDIEYVFISYNNIRPAGERLKTFGGYSSGYTAMQTMFEKIEKSIKRRDSGVGKYNHLKSIDLLDISTSIAENVVSGGVRRSALIVFCDPDDKEVIEAKQELYKNINGIWLENSDISHRKLSNNTVLYEKKPSFEVIKDQFEKIRYASEPSFGVFENMKKRNPNAKGGNPLTCKNADLKLLKLTGTPLEPYTPSIYSDIYMANLTNSVW